MRASVRAIAQVTLESTLRIQAGTEPGGLTSRRSDGEAVDAGA